MSAVADPLWQFHDDNCKDFRAILLTKQKSNTDDTKQNVVAKRHKSFTYCIVWASTSWRQTPPVKWACPAVLTRSISPTSLPLPVVHSTSGLKVDTIWRHRKIRHRVESRAGRRHRCYFRCRRRSMRPSRRQSFIVFWSRLSYLSACASNRFASSMSVTAEALKRSELASDRVVCWWSMSAVVARQASKPSLHSYLLYITTPVTSLRLPLGNCMNVESKIRTPRNSRYRPGK